MVLLVALILHLYLDNSQLLWRYNCMKKFWNTYKIWILIGLMYAGFFFLKIFKVLNSQNRLKKSHFR